MAKGKISEDQLKFILTADASTLEQEIHKSEKAISDLEKTRKSLLEQETAMRRAHLTAGQEYKDLTFKIKQNAQALANEKKKLNECHKALGVNSMTMTQLKKEARNLQRQLDDTSKSLHPKEYEEYSNRLNEVKDRMAELKNTSLGLKDIFGKNGFSFSSLFQSFNSKGVKDFLFGSFMASSLKGLGGKLVSIIKGAFEEVKLFYNYSLEVEEARRLTKEFFGVAGSELTLYQSQISAIAKDLGRDYKDVLSSVDTLTKQYGLSVMDAIELIKDGIQAGADLNGTFLSQIQQFAPAFRDAGVGAEELIALITQTRSGLFSEEGMALMQTAVNRVRKMGPETAKALDEIGIKSEQLEEELVNGDTSLFGAIQKISAKIKDLPENSKEVGMVMQSVFGKTASNEGMQLIQSFADMKTNMEELKKVTGEYGELERQRIEIQAELNKKMTEMFGIGTGGFKELTQKCTIFIMKGLVKTINYLLSIYDNLKLVRVAVAAIFIAFDTGMKFSELAFRWLVDTIKGTGRLLRGLALMIEGALTFDPKEMEEGWKSMKDSFVVTWKDLVSDAKNVGERWAENLFNSAQKAINGREIKAPDIEGSNTTNGIGGGGDSDDPSDGRGGGKAHASSTDDNSITKFKEQRKAEIEFEKESYNEQIRALKRALSDKRISQEQFNVMMIAFKKNNAESLLEIEQSYYKMAESLQIEDDKKRVALLQEQNQNVVNAEQAQQQIKLEQYQAFYKQLENIGKIYPVKLTDEQELELQKATLEGYYQAALQMAEGNAEQIEALEQAKNEALDRINAERLQMEREAEQKRLQIRQEYGLATLDEQYALELKKLQDLKDKEFKTEEEYQRAVAHLEQEYEDKKFQIREQYGLVSDQELYERKRQQLDLQHEQGLIDEENYDKAKTQIAIDHWKQQFDYYKDMFANAISALQDAEMARVDAKYDAEIEAARNAGKDTTELENKKANEKLKIQKKYADVDFAIKASQIIADTATGIARLWASPGYPMAIPLTALLAVIGTAQLATANAERRKVKKMTLNGTGSSGNGSGARVASGREQGGFIDVEREQDGKQYRAKFDPHRRGFVDRPTVLVGEGPAGRSREWVASNDAVSNPTVAPILSLLDHAQRMGNIRTLDFNKLIARQMVGHSSGGSFVPGKHIPATTTASGGTDLSVLVRLSDILDRIEQNGIPASVALTELEQKQALRDKSRKIASKP